MEYADKRNDHRDRTLRMHHDLTLAASQTEEALTKAQAKLRQDEIATATLLTDSGDPKPAPRSSLVRKPNEALRPSKLMRENSPVEFRVWISQFRAYYTSSRMDLASITEQQAYFKACLEPALVARVEATITTDLPVFTEIEDASGSNASDAEDPDQVDLVADLDGEPSSCMQILHREYIIAYPVFTRRFNLLRSRQPPGMTPSDHMSKYLKEADECDLENLTKEQFCVHGLIASFTDGSLLKDLWKLKDPKLADLRDTIQAWEISKRVIQSSLHPKPVASAAQTSKTKTTTPKTTSTAQKPTKSSSAKAQPAKNYQCYRCGNKNATHQCPALEAVCKHCKKKGHYAGICQAKKREQAKPGTHTVQVEPIAEANVAAPQ